jgi:hypothetical protein
LINRVGGTPEILGLKLSEGIGLVTSLNQFAVLVPQLAQAVLQGFAAQVQIIKVGFRFGGRGIDEGVREPQPVSLLPLPAFQNLVMSDLRGPGEKVGVRDELVMLRQNDDVRLLQSLIGILQLSSQLSQNEQIQLPLMARK